MCKSFISYNDTGLVMHRGNGNCTPSEIHQHCPESIAICSSCNSSPKDPKLQQQGCKVHLQDTSTASNNYVLMTCRQHFYNYVV